MKHVSLAEARANIAQLLDESRREEAREAARKLREMRKAAPYATVEEILQWRDEGRRH